VRDEGAAQPNLSAKSIGDYIVPYPKIMEQDEIVSLFDRIDHLITLHQRKLEKLQELKKGYLQKMFC
jgi:type I restriction enzyme S subunit